jgi:23S rRNA pseudouridine2605 synthase
MINNEEWQGSPRRTSPGAGRDGRPFERRDQKFDNSDQRGAGRYNQENNDGDERPRFKPDLSKRNESGNSFERRGSGNRESYGQQEGRPRFKPNNGGGYNKFPRQDGEQRPFRRNDGEQRSFNRNDGDQRSFNRNDGEQRSFNRNDGEQRSFNRNDGDSRPFQRRDGEFRPRRQEGEFRPRTNNDGPGSGGRQRFSIKKQGESNGSDYVEARFDSQDNSSRRPRIKRTADYNPNAKYSQKKQAEYRRNEVDLTKPVRLNKFLANAGICSRREADEFIKAGVITVNGEFVTEMGIKVMHSDKIMFHNQLVRSERKVYIVLNKPKDTVTTSEDTHDRRTVMDLVRNACSERIYPVGRLDRNTTGVLLLTNDGDLASKLTHPKYDKKKIYHVVLDKPLEIPDFEAILEGVTLEDEKIPADALNFVRDDDFKQVGIEIHSGQNRVVRRIFEKLGYKVVRLDRVYFAGLTKKNLPRGKYRFLTEREVNMLKMGAYE